MIDIKPYSYNKLCLDASFKHKIYLQQYIKKAADLISAAFTINRII